MRHEPFTEWAALYAVGTLAGEERTQFETHLATGCPDCTTMLSELSAVVATLAWAAPAVSPRPELRERLLARVRTEQAPEAPAPSFSIKRLPTWVWWRRALWVGRVAAAGLELRLAEGETIWTESSYKYEPQGIRQLVEPAGFIQRSQWIDEPSRFALTLFEAA